MNRRHLEELVDIASSVEFVSEDAKPNPDAKLDRRLDLARRASLIWCEALLDKAGPNVLAELNQHADERWNDVQAYREGLSD